ncbi:MAG: GntR family transcriptional regulator [Lachnospiraceae bacterium]
MMKPKKESITDQVYEIIKAQILNQTYGFGSKLNINKLANELNVSNTPIREAIYKLEKDGLTVFNPNSGPKVVDMDESRFYEIVETTLVLLIGGYKLCLLKNKIPKLINLMEENLQQQKNIINSGSEQEYAKASVTFEECILLALDNSKLCSIYNSLFDLLILAVLYDHKNSKLDRYASIQDHERILSALKQNSKEEFVALLRKHYSRNVRFSK